MFSGTDTLGTSCSSLPSTNPTDCVPDLRSLLRSVSDRLSLIESRISDILELLSDPGDISEVDEEGDLPQAKHRRIL